MKRDAPIMLTPMVKFINWTGVPHGLRGKVSAVCRSLKDCEDLVAWFGDGNFCPFQPVLLLIPGNPSPIAIVGDGYATAAELRDCAVDQWEITTERIAKTGRNFDFDEARERAGLPRAEDFDTLYREAMWARIQKHKASPVTDPFRQPDYPNETNKVMFPHHPGVPYEVEK